MKIPSINFKYRIDNVLAGLSPDHHCKVPEGQHINGSIPWLNGEGRERGGSWHQCEMYVNSTLNNSTMKCQDGWTYEKNPNEISIVTEVRNIL